MGEFADENVHSGFANESVNKSVVNSISYSFDLGLTLNVVSINLSNDIKR